MTHVLLFLVAVVAGALNAVAGGGSFVALPALISVGVSPVAANATTTLAMWPASASSVFAYRREIARSRSWLVALGGASLVGGLLGGWLLIRTSDARFMRLLPWLMLVAAATFTFGTRLAAYVPQPGRAVAPGRPPIPIWIVLLQLIVAIYGGYFGGGIGIMMLAAFTLAGLVDIHEMNGIKSVLAVLINGVALTEFIVGGVVVWGPGLTMVAGSVLGGYGGAALARRSSTTAIRGVVIVIAWAMTAYFFLR